MNLEPSNSPKILQADLLPVIDRGAGVKTTPFIGKWNSPGWNVTTGTTSFQPGTGLPLHIHNVEETVMILRGEAIAVVGEERHNLKPGDATWVPAEVPHCFINGGDSELLIYWVYGGQHVTRTIVATGETFEHLSEADRTFITKPD